MIYKKTSVQTNNQGISSFWFMFFFQNLPADIKESITDIIKFMLEREYVKVCIISKNFFIFINVSLHV